MKLEPALLPSPVKQEDNRRTFVAAYRFIFSRRGRKQQKTGTSSGSDKNKKGTKAAPQVAEHLIEAALVRERLGLSSPLGPSFLSFFQLIRSCYLLASRSVSPCAATNVTLLFVCFTGAHPYGVCCSCPPKVRRAIGAFPGFRSHNPDNNIRPQSAIRDLGCAQPEANVAQSA